jgi:ADP-heptose:LPS heptosyltransferase
MEAMQEPATPISGSLTKILVIKLGALGDIFLATEAFQSIRTHHPQARIVLLTRPAFMELARTMPWFDEVWPDPSPKMWQVAACWNLARRFRAGGFERVYDLQGNDRAAFYRRLGGWSVASQWVYAALTEKKVAQAGLAPMPVAQRHRQMLAAAGVPSAGPADLSWLDGPTAGFRLPERFVLLVPGSAPKHLHKRWPAAGYAALARALATKGLGSVVVGTKAENETVAEICAAAPSAMNLCGQTTIPQIGALARLAAGVVGNDTGPIHITAAVGAPTLVLMSGRSDPVRMLPHGPEVAYLQEADLRDLSPQKVEQALRLRSTAVG